MAVASDNVFPKVILDGVTSDPAAPSNDNWKLYAKPDGLYARSSNTIVGPLGSGGGAVATDAIWDAAGDLAVGTGANTAARLAKGAAGANLSTYNGVVTWNGGTSFPASPATGDRYWRSDLTEEFFYNGTRWLSTTLYIITLIPKSLPPYSANGTFMYCPAFDSTFDVWIEDVVIFHNTGATNTGAVYWTFSFDKATDAGGSSALVTANTSADSTSKYLDKRVAVNALYGTTSSNTWLILGGTKTGSPSNIDWLACYFTYRRVAA